MQVVTYRFLTDFYDNALPLLVLQKEVETKQPVNVFLVWIRTAHASHVRITNPGSSAVSEVEFVHKLCSSVLLKTVRAVIHAEISNIQRIEVLYASDKAELRRTVLAPNDISNR